VSRPGSRRRALGFAVLAAFSALGSIAIAARYGRGVADGYGEMRPVVVVERDLRAGPALDRRSVRASLGVREVPERFVPPDALSHVSEALGERPQAVIPAGSYLLGSHFRLADRREEHRRKLSGGVHPIEVTVASAAPLAGHAGVARVDVVAADEPGVIVNPRVRVLAKRVPLLAIRRMASGGGERRWRATLGLDRAQTLTVIEAENFARQIRLLPR
jgi:Flp pilus assembly protein CpaB